MKNASRISTYAFTMYVYKSRKNVDSLTRFKTKTDYTIE